MTDKKIILFGGTFDPIHLGHTTVAAYAGEHIDADKIIFIPAKYSPLKSSSPVASEADRLKMLKLAICENEKFEVSDYELNKAEQNFTLETVRHFQQTSENGATIYWLIGADSIEDLANWYKITELIDECNLSVMYRAGFSLPDFSNFKNLLGTERIKKLQRNIIKTPLIDISSTEIRKRLAAGQNVSNMLTLAVASYIYEKGLYRRI